MLDFLFDDLQFRQLLLLLLLKLQLDVDPRRCDAAFGFTGSAGHAVARRQRLTPEWNRHRSADVVADLRLQDLTVLLVQARVDVVDGADVAGNVENRRRHERRRLLLLALCCVAKNSNRCKQSSASKLFPKLTSRDSRICS